jgi:DNA uptake protein ComE-like DNA-binding protein
MSFFFYEDNQLCFAEMAMNEKDENRPSGSFVTGVVVVVFLMIVHQVAMFVHRAAVMSIAANRDEPDTVYVYQERQELSIDRNDNGYVRREVMKQSAHSPVAKAVRQSVARKTVESFRFDPNTVSVDDLCRLGFSQKQAQSIDNYRQKGGRFRRKEDFAKSFVVSDSIYRRLESYMDIPLIDLNLADSATFDSLPGIGGWFARKIVEHREALGGYSYKEQLMDIYRFTEDKYLALEDLITVSPEYITPYPLWTLPADSLRLHPYIKDYETARSIVLYRENSDKEDMTVEGLLKSGILTPDSADRLSRCKIRSP